MKLELEYTLEKLEETASYLVQQLSFPCILLFSGEMGAGKTTLIKAICKHLGVLETVSSPTYALVNEYKSTKYGRMFHFDLFRTINEAEIEDFGFSEYLHSGYSCIVEWPEKAPNLLRNLAVITCTLSYSDLNSRFITVTY